ncbi:alpha/beta hydrolase [Paenibacillus cineris]|uniref:alpha/beta hydrolase n=1 Tax=Paenibacillus cineris TaxID=237530 RepID=UPI001B03F181|nr:alpha/beta hydrolase [Paenibacillus cineris]GIO63488.1 hypothetical protein J43TS9_50620 [Paenibacillus cineris]
MSTAASRLPDSKQRIPLWEDVPLGQSGPENEGCPSITPYLLEGEGPFPMMVVCPGGGYVMRADHEGEPIALWLNSIGVSAVVLNYRVSPNRHPVPLGDAQRAIRTVRSLAADWNIDPARVGILGFSAGGHLASTAGTHFDAGQADAEDPVERESSRPDLQVLCYPVISFGPYTHEGSKYSLLGEEPDAELVQYLSNETRVTPDTPPAFIWHTADDGAVPAENSLLFALALSREKIPYALHVFEAGRHGLGLAEEEEAVKAWPDLCATWLRERQFIQ